ncbi:MAG: hypothetical protein KGJ49_04365 [Alphaproteobacteria bacterium]|nr:hypothetical protein [Alphaproteobacteria bacterium]
MPPTDEPDVVTFQRIASAVNKIKRARRRQLRRLMPRYLADFLFAMEEIEIANSATNSPRDYAPSTRKDNE